jgi:hypothetical protein
MYLGLLKCEGIDCPLKETCFRHVAPSTGDRQAWLKPSPYDFEEGECKRYMETNLKKDS